MTLQWIRLGRVLMTTAAAAVAVAQLNGQTQPTGDFRNAETAEVRNAQGQIVLQGKFGASVEEEGGVERSAPLAPTDVDNDASGEAEVEFEKGATEQEVEFTVQNLQPEASFTFVLDGKVIVSGKTDQKGSAEVEIMVTVPPTAK